MVVIHCVTVKRRKSLTAADSGSGRERGERENDVAAVNVQKCSLPLVRRVKMAAVLLNRDCNGRTFLFSTLHEAHRPAN